MGYSRPPVVQIVLSPVLDRQPLVEFWSCGGHPSPCGGHPSPCRMACSSRPLIASCASPIHTAHLIPTRVPAASSPVTCHSLHARHNHPHPFSFPTCPPLQPPPTFQDVPSSLSLSPSTPAPLLPSLLPWSIFPHLCNPPPSLPLSSLGPTSTACPATCAATRAPLPPRASMAATVRAGLGGAAEACQEARPTARDSMPGQECRGVLRCMSPGRS